ncbi:hypothetical protein Ocin01_19431, partial [Orchesella cincta]
MSKAEKWMALNKTRLYLARIGYLKDPGSLVFVQKQIITLKLEGCPMALYGESRVEDCQQSAAKVYNRRSYPPYFIYWDVPAGLKPLLGIESNELMPPLNATPSDLVAHPINKAGVQNRTGALIYLYSCSAKRTAAAKHTGDRSVEWRVNGDEERVYCELTNRAPDLIQTSGEDPRRDL